MNFDVKNDDILTHKEHAQVKEPAAIPMDDNEDNNLLNKKLTDSSI